MLSAKPEEDKESAFELDQVCLIESAEDCVDVAAPDRRDLVDHQEAVAIDASDGVSGDRDPQERCLHVGGGERADGQRLCRVEAVVLNDQCWSWLARIDTASHGDDVTTPHSSQSAETAST